MDVTEFAALLRRYRLAAGLSQEELAGRAQLSLQAVSALERGTRRAPRATTVHTLAAALTLTPEQAAVFDATVRRRRRPRPAPLPPPPGLPVASTLLIGRATELAVLPYLLCHSEGRLLTLTGPGGVGKTRLAAQVAHAVADAFSDGVAWMELAPLRDPELVATTVAHRLGLRDGDNGSAGVLARLRAYLRDRRVLLVLDNVEHLLPARALLAMLLQECPRLCLLVTSRMALRLPGEQEYAVAPLAVPLPTQRTVADVERVPAVALFLQRARQAVPGLTLTEATAPVVAAVCRRLDGLPLALELAAASVKVLPPAALLERLGGMVRAEVDPEPDQGTLILDVLAAGAWDLPDRQQTMRATIAWSYDLLEPAAQALFRRLAIFAGGCTLEAIISVCVETGAGSEGAEMVREALVTLVDHSLVHLIDGAAGLRAGPSAVRYGMLETVREYGLEQLERHGEVARMQEQHLAWCLALAERAEQELTGPAQGLWLDRLEKDHDNLRAALGWARERGAMAEGLRLAGALWRFWHVRGYLDEGRSWLDTTLAGEKASQMARAKALNGAGVLAKEQGDYGRAAALHQESLTLWRALGDTLGVATSHGHLGWVAYHQGDYGRAAALHQESLTLWRTSGNSWGIATALGNLGWVAYQQGEYGRAAVLHQESLALRRALGDMQGIGDSLGNLAVVAERQGEYERAVTLHEEGLALSRELGDRRSMALSLSSLGNVLRQQRDLDAACARYAAGLRLSRDIGARDLVADVLENLAWIAGARGSPRQAAQLGGAAQALRETICMPVALEQQSTQEYVVQAARAALGEETFAAAWAEGRAMALEQAVALANTIGSG